MTSEELEKLFKDYNKRYFGNQLDEDTEVYFVRNLKDEKGIHLDGYELDGDIFINANIKKSWNSVAITLLHEMVHAALPDYKGDKLEGVHGMRFKAKIVELFNKGAYDNLLTILLVLGLTGSLICGIS